MKIKRVLSLILAISLSGMLLAGCGTVNKPKTQKELEAKKVKVEITMNDGGVMKAELYPDVAPVTVENFVKLAKEGFYDNTIFHRVIAGFMIQGGGCDLETGALKPAASIRGEFTENGFENNLLHERGVLSMARTNQPNSASSQFFIMHETAPHLDGKYAAFGRLTDGFDVLDRIATTPTDSNDVPIAMQVIKSIRVVEE